MLVFLPILIGMYNLFIPINAPTKIVQVAVCHSIPETDGMANFADIPEFQALHSSPLPLEYQVSGANIEFPSEDGIPGKGYLIKTKKKSNKWLFVYQEWWGLNDYVKRQADQFYNQLGGKVNVLALDMYDGKVTADPKEAGQWVQSVVEIRLENIIKRGRVYVGKKAQIASVGWCFGGGWALKSAILTGNQNIGSVMYYGMPVKDIEKLKTLNSDVLGLFATENFISKAVIEEFAANMKTAGKKLEYKIFDAAHGFANPSNPKHDEAKTFEANTMALQYLEKKFKL